MSPNGVFDVSGPYTGEGEVSIALLADYMFSASQSAA
jgi:hypothetical protein